MSTYLAGGVVHPDDVRTVQDDGEVVGDVVSFEDGGGEVVSGRVVETDLGFYVNVLVSVVVLKSPIKQRYKGHVTTPSVR